MFKIVTFLSSAFSIVLSRTILDW